MNLSRLDNPVWHALNSHHRHLAIRGEIAARYPSDVLLGAALPTYDRAGLADLTNIVDPGEFIGLVSSTLPDNLPGWQEVERDALPQMVCEGLNPAPSIDDGAVRLVTLAPADVPEMLDLIAIAQPGPFLPRTIALGTYIGLRHDGRLIAMGGERLHLTGFCEISAVCTHPHHRGRGYGGALTTHLARQILERGETPFLHHTPGNENAARLYRKLGFRRRTVLPLAILTRTETAPAS